MAGPTLAGKVTLDDSQAAAAMRRIANMGAAAATKLEASMGGALRNLASPIAALGPTIAAAFAGTAIARGVGEVFSAGRALQVLHRETGASVAGLTILQAKFRQAGLDSDTVGRSIFRLQKSIAGIEDDENKGGAGRLRQLGLDMAALEKASPDRQLMMVGAALARVGDETQRNNAAMQIFGRTGAELNAVFTAGFAQVSPDLAAKAAMLQKNAALFEQVSIKLAKVGNIFKTFYIGVADQVASTLDPVLARIEKINLVGIGQKFGASLVTGAQAFVGVFKNPGALADAVFYALMADNAKMGNALVGNFRYAGEVLMASLRATPAILAKVGDGIGFSLLAGAEKFAAAAITGGTKVAAVLSAGINWVSTHGVSGLATSLLSAAARFASAMVAAIKNPVAAVKALVSDVATQTKKNVTNDTSETLDFALASAANGKGFDVAGGLNKTAGENADRAGASFAQAGSIASQAVAAPKFAAPDVFGAAGLNTKAQQALYRLRLAGAGLIGTPGAAGAGNGPTGAPSTLQQTAFLAQSHMALASSHAPAGADPAAYMFMRDNAVHNTAWGRTNATDPYTARVDRLRQMGQAAAHTIGVGGALDFDPSTRPGWTGASNFGSNFTKADWKNYNGTSGGVFANGTSLTTGGLGGGAYGATGNVWNQVSGKVGNTNDDPQKAMVGHLQAIAGYSQQLLAVWNGSGKGGGGGGGGGTATK